mgnify:CR=1 FL=1
MRHQTHKSIHRVAQRWLLANDATSLNRLLISVQEYRDELVLSEGTCTALIAAGESRRVDRSEHVVVKSTRYDGNTVHGDVQGADSVYQTRISFKPRRAFNCSCPDQSRRGARGGPCKHVLALGKLWLREHINPAIDTMADRLIGILEHSEL